MWVLRSLDLWSLAHCGFFEDSLYAAVAHLMTQATADIIIFGRAFGIIFDYVPDAIMDLIPDHTITMLT